MYLPLEIKYNEVAIEQNRKINLFSRKKQNIYDLINDSRIYLNYLPSKRNLFILDLGTGGGIPGVVIAIHRPEAIVVMNDSIRKKTKALQEIIKSLELKNAITVTQRAEELWKQKEFYKTFDVVVARSVGKLYDLAVWSKNAVKHGGKLICLKGCNINEETNRMGELKFIREINTQQHGVRKMLIVTFR